MEIKKNLFVIILIFICFVIIPVSAETEAKLLYSYNLTTAVNSVDTNTDGTMVFAGLENGSVITFDQNGAVLWSKVLNGTAGGGTKKIKSDNLGDITFLTKNGQRGYINSAGTVRGSIIGASAWNVSDVDVSRAGGLWWELANSTTSSICYGLYEASLTYNITSADSAWRQMGYDASNGIVAYSNGTFGSNQSNSINLLNTTNGTLVYVTSTNLGERVGLIDVAPGWVSISTSAHMVHLQMLPTGFGTQYTGTSSAGTLYDMKMSDGLSTIEARASNIDIFGMDGSMTGTYTTGGAVYSVDIAKSNGLWAVGGGADGKFYVFSKNTGSSWVVYYLGESGAQINSVAVDDVGTYAVVGRSDGTFEFYDLQSESTVESQFTADLFIAKGGSPYTNVNVTIGEYLNSIPQVFSQNITGVTDSSGKMSFTAITGRYYRIDINSGEHNSTVYQGSENYKTITVNIPVVLVAQPYQFASNLNRTSGVITTTYVDVDNANVNVRIYDMKNKVNLTNTSYAATKSVTHTYTGLANGSYKVVLTFTRSATGHSYTESIYLTGTSAIDNMTPQQKLFMNGVYILFLMLVSLTIGSASTKAGVVVLAALFNLGIFMGFLPFALQTAGIGFILGFIALVTVLRRES